MKYTYKVKVINPHKKSDVIVRQLHGLNTKFDSVVVLRATLIEKLGEQVPETVNFDVGYYHGQAHSKIWLISESDLKAMYQKHPSGEITLWCVGRSAEQVTSHGLSKRGGDDFSAGPSKRQKREEEVDIVFQELKEKHSTKFDTPRLRLWARMIANKIHDDLDIPPNTPAFSSTPKRPRQQSRSSTISGAAPALVKALEDERHAQGESETAILSRQPRVSPGKAIDLRMKNYEQLRYVQQLFDDGILCETEYMEQKQGILSSLRKL